MLHVVLFQPEIPPNTGNIIRLCANTGATLHLIEPLGFDLSDSRVKRAGLDYHEMARVHAYRNWDAFTTSGVTTRLFALSTRSEKTYSEARFKNGDGLLFGPETSGLPEDMLRSFEPEFRLRLPMLPHSRSLNLSNSVAVTLFEAWRQLSFKGSAYYGQSSPFTTREP